MPDDSSGIYNVPAGTLVNTGDTVLPSQHNPWANDSSAAISNRFSKDGRAPATGDWDINNFRLKQVGTATSNTDAVNKQYVDTQITSVNQNAEKISTKSANYTALLADKATSFRFTAAATLALTPAATLLNNWWCEVWATNGNVIIDPDSAETINGAATLVLQTGQAAKVFCTGTAFFAWVFSDSLSGPQIQGYSFGLNLTTNATDAANDIDIAVGSAASDISPYYLMRLTTSLTKRIDAAWAVGNNNGGLDTGTVAAAGTYYIWLIQRSDTLVTDALFSLSSTAPTMPANYDRKRLIGNLVRDSSVNGPPSPDLRSVAIKRNPSITPSGTAFTLSGIPSGVQKVSVKFAGTLISAVSTPIMKLGTSGGLVSTGYLSRAVGFQNQGLNVAVSTTSHLLMDSVQTGEIWWGVVTLRRLEPGSSRWIIEGPMSRASNGLGFSNGTILLGGELTQLQITTAAGTATFSGASSVAIEWEF